MRSPITRSFRECLLALDGVRKQGPVRRASVVYTTDTPSDCIYLVHSGYVKIARRAAGSKEVILYVVGPGQIFGESALFEDTRRNCCAEVLQDGVLYEIPRDQALELCDSRPEFWREISHWMIHRNSQAEEKIELLCLHDVESRILHYLNRMHSIFEERGRDDEEYTLPLTQNELANLVGATRETTSTTLNTLARDGYIRLGRRMVTVTSEKSLEVALRRKIRTAGV